jgi:hypothetical protein
MQAIYLSSESETTCISGDGSMKTITLWHSGSAAELMMRTRKLVRPKRAQTEGKTALKTWDRHQLRQRLGGNHGWPQV